MIRTQTKAALYARFSSDNQRTESIDAQLRAMHAYCDQHNYVIAETYIDEAKSATTDRRPAFQQMIADSAERRFHIVLVHKLDRFARNRYDSAVYKRELKKNGVLVYSVLENLDDSPESIMLEAVIEGMAEYYSQNIARETMKGLKENAWQCKHTGGKPPLGYDVDEESKRLIVNPAEAETVNLIFDMYSQGYGYSPILARLHQEQRKTKNGKDFQKNSLYSILTNPKYQGKYVFNRSSAKSITGTRNTHLLKDFEEMIVVDGGCPQIVDPTVYETVQKRITENQKTGGRGKAKENYLLSGKVFCKECGRAMHGNSHYSGRNKLHHVTYRCPSQRHQCANKEINKEYLEATVVSLLQEQLLNPQALRSIRKRIRQHGEKPQESRDDDLKEELAATNEALRNVADAVAAGLLSDALVRRLQELEAKKSRIETELAKVQTKVTVWDIDPNLILSQFTEVRGTPASPAYKMFLCSLIDRIEIGRYSVDITLKTGLDIVPELNSTYSVRRQEIYARKKTA